LTLASSNRQPDCAVCVVGGGPAGSTLAARLAQLGHEVCLIERRAFPRRHVGESLSPGVLSLLELTAARPIVEDAGFWPVESVFVKWGDGVQERRNPVHAGLLVDRGRFDQLLLERARALGVRILQPAVVVERSPHNLGWRLRVESDGCAFELNASFLADASGRATSRSKSRKTVGHRTLALHAYWSSDSLPRTPMIEAGADAWFWGVPLPDGTYDTLAFVDTASFRADAGAPLGERFAALLEGTEVRRRIGDARRVSRVYAIDATAYLESDSVASASIKVGEAAIAIDPISSSGVQNALQSALAGAITVNTLLRRPGSADIARAFYHDHLAEASARHARWAANHYATIATGNGSEFWQRRAEGAVPDNADDPSRNDNATPPPATPLALSPSVTFIEMPCIDAEFVAVRTAVRHPNLPNDVAFIGERELVPLLRELPAGLSRLELAHHWSSHLPFDEAARIVGWLIRYSLLVKH
jgi:flavin-dependent dehydrogenase